MSGDWTLNGEGSEDAVLHSVMCCELCTAWHDDHLAAGEWNPLGSLSLPGTLLSTDNC